MNSLIQKPSLKYFDHVSLLDCKTETISQEIWGSLAKKLVDLEILTIICADGGPKNIGKNEGVNQNLETKLNRSL